MLFCIKCGKKINDDAIYCPYCGEKQLGYEDEPKNNNEFIEEVSPDEILQNNYQEIIDNQEDEPKDTGHVTPFGVSIKRLFTKFFVFKGRAERSEFNFQLIFTLIVTAILEFILMSFSQTLKEVINEIVQYVTVANTQELSSLGGFDIDSILDSASQYDMIFIAPLIGTSLFYMFMIAPFYRRIYDAYQSHKFATIVVIVLAFNLFVTITGSLIPSNTFLYALLDGFGILSIANIVFLYLAVTRKSSFKNYNE